MRPFVELPGGDGVGVNTTLNTGDSVRINTADGTAAPVGTSDRLPVVGNPFARLDPGRPTWGVGAGSHPGSVKYEIAW